MKNLVFTLLCLWLASAVKAQTIKQLSVAATTESIAFPFTRYLPIHPGAEIGATFKQTDKEKSTRQWNSYLGFFYHERLETGFYLRGEYLHRFNLLKHLGVEALGSLGYLHTFYPNELYVQNEETGKYEKVNQVGRPHALATIGIGLTYTSNSPVEPFIRQETGIETPFGEGFPVIVHSFLKLGLNFKLNNNENN